MSTVWIKHPTTGHVAEIPRDALAIYRQSGWDTLTDDEIAERAQAAADEAAEIARAIEEQAEKALPTSAPPPISRQRKTTETPREAPIPEKENG